VEVEPALAAKNHVERGSDRGIEFFLPTRRVEEEKGFARNGGEAHAEAIEVQRILGRIGEAAERANPQRPLPSLALDRVGRDGVKDFETVGSQTLESERDAKSAEVDVAGVRRTGLRAVVAVVAVVAGVDAVLARGVGVRVASEIVPVVDRRAAAAAAKNHLSELSAEDTGGVEGVDGRRHDRFHERLFEMLYHLGFPEAERKASTNCGQGIKLRQRKSVL